jgi:hypothetical protein
MTAIEIRALPLIEDCASSRLRGLEHAAFTGAVVKAEENAKITHERGLRLSALLAAAPFTFPRPGPERPAAVDAWLLAACKERGVMLAGGDTAFIHDTLLKRDFLVARFAEKHNGSLTELFCDTGLSARMSADFGDTGVTLTGVPAFWIQARTGNGGWHSLLMDFTTGFAPDTKDGGPSAFVRGMASLAAFHHRTTRSVTVALLHANDAEPEQIVSHRFTRREIDLLADGLRPLLEQQAGLEARWRANHNEVGGSLADELDARASTGNHCTDCPGLVCCGKVIAGLETTSREFAAMDAQSVFDVALRAIKNHSPENPMNIETLRRALEASKSATEQLAVAKKVWDEGSAIARDSLARDDAGVAGWRLKPGVARLAIAEDKKPAEVFAALKPVLGETTFEEFVAATCNVTATAAAKLVADRNKIPERSVHDTLLKLLAEKTPLVKKPNQASVIREDAATAEADPPLPVERLTGRAARRSA